MHQTGSDETDLHDALPQLHRYLNDAYDQLLAAWEPGAHISGMGGPSPSGTAVLPLVDDEDKPALPDWTHQGMVDYATSMLFRNGNAHRQLRGMPYLSAFQDVRARIFSEGGKRGMPVQYRNVFSQRVYEPKPEGGGFDPFA